MDDKAKEARNAYMRAYRAANKEKLRLQDKARRKADPERYKKYVSDYWNRKAAFEEGVEDEQSKQTPKKFVWRKWKSYRDGKIAFKCCPACKKPLSYANILVECCSCGQKLDWNE